IWFLSMIAIALVPQLSNTAFAQTADSKAKPASSVTGKVTIGDKPAPGILITATNVNSETVLGQATSDTDGNYRINGLPAGFVSIVPFAPLYVFPTSPMATQ